MKSKAGLIVLVCSMVSSVALAAPVDQVGSVPPEVLPAANCIPFGSTISFTASAVYVGNAANGDQRVIAGDIPAGDALVVSGSYGAVSLTGGTASSPGSQVVKLAGQRVDGTILEVDVHAPASVINGTNSGTAAPTRFDSSGTIQLSPFIQQMLIQKAKNPQSGYGLGYGTAPEITLSAESSQLACVSKIAISMQRTLSSYSNTLYLGTVYFYLNGTQNRLSLDF